MQFCDFWCLSLLLFFSSSCSQVRWYKYPSTHRFWWDMLALNPRYITVNRTEGERNHKFKTWSFWFFHIRVIYISLSCLFIVIFQLLSQQLFLKRSQILTSRPSHTERAKRLESIAFLLFSLLERRLRFWYVMPLLFVDVLMVGTA